MLLLLFGGNYVNITSLISYYRDSIKRNRLHMLQLQFRRQSPQYQRYSSYSLISSFDRMRVLLLVSFFLKPPFSAFSLPSVSFAFSLLESQLTDPIFQEMTD